MTEIQRWDIAHGPTNSAMIKHELGDYVLAADAEAAIAAAKCGGISIINEEPIKRFDYYEVLYDTEYTEGTYVRYEYHLSAIEKMKELIDEARVAGYAEAEQYFTNDCFSCGYAGEWSTYICNICQEQIENEDIDDE